MNGSLGKWQMEKPRDLQRSDCRGRGTNVMSRVKRGPGSGLCKEIVKGRSREFRIGKT